MHVRVIIGSVISLIGLAIALIYSYFLGGALFVFGVIIFFNREEDEIEQIHKIKEVKHVKSNKSKRKKR